MDIKEAERLALGQPTNCPICGGSVSKPTKSDKERSNSIVCENEYYVHYIDRKGNHVLQQYINPKTNADSVRFAPPQEKIPAKNNAIWVGPDSSGVDLGNSLGNNTTDINIP